MSTKRRDRSQGSFYRRGGGVILLIFTVQRQLYELSGLTRSLGILRPGNCCHPDLSLSDNDALMSCGYVL